VSTAYCTGAHACAAKLAVGAACGGNHECQNGQCVDGFCCGDAACNGCNSCGVTGHHGTCWPMPAGDSNGYCSPANAESCGQTGECDGAGHCALYDAGTVCAAALCTPGTGDFTGVSTCDGAGTCVTPAPTTCGAYVCAADGVSCETDCVSDLQCAAGSSCQGTMCGPS
jgi:hypothetical protein